MKYKVKFAVQYEVEDTFEVDSVEDEDGNEIDMAGDDSDTPTSGEPL